MTREKLRAMTREKLRAALGPTYLFFCLVLGGSVQGVWGATSLQLLAVLIIAWSFAEPGQTNLQRPMRQLGWLVVAAVTLFAVHLLPLPPAIIMAMPGREIVAEGRVILGLRAGWSSLSLSPYDTAAAILPLLPPVAMLCAIVRLRAYSPHGLAVAVLTATVAAVALGALQTGSPDPPTSPWYLYKISNFGVATGFFANSNHMASMLLVSIPFMVALAAHSSRAAKEARKRFTLLVVGAAGLGLIMVGLALNGSLSGYGLVIPVTIASLLIAIPLGLTARRAALGLCAAGMLAFFLLLFSPLSNHMPGAATSIDSRQEMLAGGTAAFTQFAPVGSGFGTFTRVYPLFERPGEVDATFVNHAHNDYLELAVETGLPGIALMLLFLLWWAAAVRRMLASPAADGFAMAGAIGSAAVLVHSAVDYPLRTAAVAALFATCIALILVSRRTASAKTDIRPTRHLVIG
ncbi:MAG: O-antigen ligase family protein [Sphingomonas sp.]|uniref:O-antigen ligase family protein n=1 Tax=Sphingomonas sp. TaxID=28214 RepID=UPI0017C7CAFC|nr:O-antigen ligase family protein [Sphingomonas sp.]MBA3666252.1 O-antigen ligase family protein [Sphingomonas sp.]